MKDEVGMNIIWTNNEWSTISCTRLEQIMKYIWIFVKKYEQYLNNIWIWMVFEQTLNSDWTEFEQGMNLVQTLF